VPSKYQHYYFLNGYYSFFFILASDPNNDGPQNWTWRFTWSMLRDHFPNKLKRFTNVYGRNSLNKNL